MMEYRVVYYGDDSAGIGSVFEPWIAYEGNDSVEADAMYADIKNDIDEAHTDSSNVVLDLYGASVIHLQLQTREVFGWVTRKRVTSGQGSMQGKGQKAQ